MIQHHIKAIILAMYAIRSRKSACAYLQDYQWRNASPLLRFQMLYRGFLSRYVITWYGGLSVGDKITIADSGCTAPRFIYLVIEPAYKIGNRKWVPARMIFVGHDYEPGNTRVLNGDDYYSMYHYDTGPMGKKK